MFNTISTLSQTSLLYILNSCPFSCVTTFSGESDVYIADTSSARTVIHLESFMGQAYGGHEGPNWLKCNTTSQQWEPTACSLRSFSSLLSGDHPTEDPDDESVSAVTTTSQLRKPDGGNLDKEIISFSCWHNERGPERQPAHLSSAWSESSLHL